MNGFLKKMASLSTVFMLVLSMVSCGNGENTTSDPMGSSNLTGRYLEQPLDTGMAAVKKLADGSLRSFSLQLGEVTPLTQFGTSTDGGKTWSFESNEEVTNFFQTVSFINGAFDTEGNLYAFLMENPTFESPSGNDEANGSGEAPATSEETTVQTSTFDSAKLYKITKDFQIEDTGYTRFAMELVDFQVTSEGNLIFKGQSEYQQLDLSTKSEKFTYSPDDTTSTFRVEGNNLIMATPSEITVYDTTTGEKTSSIPFPKDVSVTEMGAYNIQSSADEKGYYYYCEKGIFYIDKEGKTPELLLDSTNGSMIFSSQYAYSPMAMIVNEDRSILAGPMGTFGNEKLSYFYYDSDAPSVADKVLSIYSLRENSYLRQVIADFKKTNPDVQITYSTGVAATAPGMPEGSVDDALKDLSLKIQSGDIPDIMLLDGLPVEKYVQSGLFKDLSDFVNQRKEEQKYLPNVLEAFTKNNELYALPAHVYTTAMTGKNLEGVKSLTDYSNWLAKQENQKIVTQNSEIFSLFYPSLYSGWFDENGKVKEEQMRTDLEALKAIYDTQSASDSSYDMITTGDQGVSTQNIFMKMISILIGTDEINQLTGTLTSLNDYQMLTSYVEQLGIDWSLYPSEGGQLLTSDVISVTKNAKNPEICDAFLDTFMTSKDVNANLPLSETTALSQSSESIFQEETSVAVGMGEDVGDTNPLVLEKKPLREEQITELYASLGSLKVSSTENAVIKSILEKEINAYLGASDATDGNAAAPQDLDSTIKNIRSKTELYLSE